MEAYRLSPIKSTVRTDANRSTYNLSSNLVPQTKPGVPMALRSPSDTRTSRTLEQGAKMANKVFTSYRPEEEHSISLEDSEGVTHTFRLNPSLPGRLILDFMFVSGTDDTGQLAKAINTVLDKAVVDEDKEAWNAFIDEPKNGVTISVLSEVVGHVVSVLSGNPQAQV